MKKFHTSLLSLLLLIVAFLPFGLNASGDAEVRDCVVVLLDASGSMDQDMRATGEKKIEAAKQALREMVKGLDPNTNIGLLVMSGDIDHRIVSSRSEWVYPIAPLDRQKFENAVRSVSPNHGTPLATYMKMASDALLQERQRQRNYGSYKLVILTDGEADAMERRRVPAYTQEIQGRGIKIEAVGLDMAEDHSLKTMVRYSTANDGQELQERMRRAVAELSTRDINATQEALGVIAPLTTQEALMILQSLGSGGYDNSPIGK